MTPCGHTLEIPGVIAFHGQDGQDVELEYDHDWFEASSEGIAIEDERLFPNSPKHNPELSTLLHFASVVKNTGAFLEFPGRTLEYESWYKPAFVIQLGGTIKVPQGPGLGITYDDAIWGQTEKL